eukprot:Polyplicarium_translucidae@DN191_c0_g1_i1.p1
MIHRHVLYDTPKHARYTYDTPMCAQQLDVQWEVAHAEPEAHKAEVNCVTWRPVREGTALGHRMHRIGTSHAPHWDTALGHRMVTCVSPPFKRMALNSSRRVRTTGPSKCGGSPPPFRPPRRPMY